MSTSCKSDLWTILGLKQNKVRKYIQIFQNSFFQKKVYNR